MSPRRKSRGNATRTSSRINGPLYKSSDTILCNFDGQLYDATILDVKRVDALKEEEKKDDNPDPISIRSMSNDNGATCGDIFAYYLHYKNWSSTWDEWVSNDCIMPITEDSRKKQHELKLAARKEKIKKTSKKKRRRMRHTNMSESQSPSVSPEATQDDDNSKMQINVGLDVATKSKDKLDNDKVLVTDDEHEEPIEEVVDTENQTGVSSENHVPLPPMILVSKSAPYLLVQYENESSPSSSESIDNQKESAGTDSVIDKHGESDTDSFEHSASDASVDAKGLKTDDTHDQPIGESVNPENRTGFTSKNQGSTPPPLPLVPYENASASSSSPEVTEINDDSRTDKLEELTSILSKIVVVHPCSVIGNPTINDILPELQHYLSSITSIGDVEGSGFVEMLQVMFEDFCKKYIKPDARKDAEQRMRETNDSFFGSVVHYSGMYKFIVDLETQDWKKQEFYNPPAYTTYELDDLQITFRLCRDYFDVTKRFLQLKSGCPSFTLQLTDESITQDQEQTV